MSFNKEVKKLFGKPSRAERTRRLLAVRDMDPQTAESYDRAAEGNVRLRYNDRDLDAKHDARIRLSRMIEAYNNHGDSAKLFHLSTGEIE